MAGYLSASSVTDVFYILKKHLGPDKAYENTDKLLMVFHIASVTETHIRKALQIRLKDFEDSLQLACALKTGAEYLITRNKKDFIAKTNIRILDPEEFLSDWNNRYPPFFPPRRQGAKLCPPFPFLASLRESIKKYRY